jgi:hypothetical protein
MFHTILLTWASAVTVMLTIASVHHKTRGVAGRSRNDLSNLELWTGAHPSGHRVEDVVSYCREQLGLYGTDDERTGYGPPAPPSQAGQKKP